MLNSVDQNIMMKLKEHQGSCTVKEIQKALPDMEIDTLCKYLAYMRKKLSRKEGSWINFEGDLPNEASRIWLDVGVYAKLMR